MLKLKTNAQLSGPARTNVDAELQLIALSPTLLALMHLLAAGLLSGIFQLLFC